MNMKKKKTKATLIQQGLKGHTHTELILWAGQYVFMGFKTEQWLDIACVSHMFGGSFFLCGIFALKFIESNLSDWRDIHS